MSSVLVFVPTSPEQWRSTLDQAEIEGFAATAALREALGYRADQDEDAEHAAMVLASVAGLTRTAAPGKRFVLGVEVPESQVRVDGEHVDTDNGRVVVSGPVPDRRVVSWFTDEDDLDASAAAQAAHGLSLDAAWETGAVADLVAGHALLWHAAEELPPLTREGGR